MTVPIQNPVIEHVGNGVTVAFPYDFLCFSKVDLSILADLVPVDPATYTVTGLGVPTGGTVTFNTAPASGIKITIRLQMVLERLTDYQTAGDLLANVLNRDLDRVWLALQGSTVDIASALKFPPGEDAAFIPPVSERKGRVLVFDPATGAPTVSQDNWVDQAANAAASAASAAQSASEAQGAVADANTAVALARDWATKLGGTVDGSEFSAKYYAALAASQAGVRVFASIPTTNQGVPVCVAPHGILYWDATASRYISAECGETRFFSTVTPPPGFIAENGATLQIADYPALFARIGTRYGGNGTTTFVAPEGRGEFFRGADSGRGVDPGRVVGTAQGELVGPHTHLQVQGNGGTTASGTVGVMMSSANSGAATNIIATTTAENRPRNVARLACVKYQ